MGSSDMPQSHDTTRRIVHWGAALLVALAWGVGITMEELPRGAPRDLAMQAHYSLGLLVLGAAALRVIWRAVSPASRDAQPGWQARLALAMHAALVVLTVLLPLSGLLDRWARGRPVQVFGGWLVSPPFAIPGGRLWGEAHEVLASLLLAAVAAHVAAALWHHFVLRDRSLVRMLPRLGR